MNIIVQNFVVIGQTVAEIWLFFKMATGLHFEFLKFKILTVARLKMVRMCLHTKFCSDLLNCCWVMVI